MRQAPIETAKLDSTIGEVCERKQGGRGKEQDQETSDWKLQLVVCLNALCTESEIQPNNLHLLVIASFI
jgi:hypothetical protein